MKVLFVSSGKNGGVSYIIKNQGESLRKKGVEVNYFTIRPGIISYLLSIFKIREEYKKGNYDLVHAHYSLSAFAASLAGFFPMVVSFMGSDIHGSILSRLITRCFGIIRWDVIIVKTLEMKELLGMNKIWVIPNGVDLERFGPFDRVAAREHIGISQEKRLVLFISADENRPEKNFELARRSVNALGKSDALLLKVTNVPNEEIPFYINAADVLLLTSKWEGSVNVIKEALACNCPVVSTDVGDVKLILSDTPGCFITSFDYKEIAEKLFVVLNEGKRCEGRRRIIETGLDSDTVSEKIIELYRQVINARENSSEE